MGLEVKHIWLVYIEEGCSNPISRDKGLFISEVHMATRNQSKSFRKNIFSLVRESEVLEFLRIAVSWTTSGFHFLVHPIAALALLGASSLLMWIFWQSQTSENFIACSSSPIQRSSLWHKNPACKYFKHCFTIKHRLWTIAFWSRQTRSKNKTCLWLWWGKQKAGQHHGSFSVSLGSFYLTSKDCGQCRLLKLEYWLFSQQREFYLFKENYHLVVLNGS